jgi:hypothetical protein
MMFESADIAEVDNLTELGRRTGLASGLYVSAENSLRVGLRTFLGTAGQDNLDIAEDECLRTDLVSVVGSQTQPAVRALGQPCDAFG